MNDDNREREALILRLVKNSRDMIYRMSLPDGVYEYVSPACLEITGYSSEEHYNSPMLVKEVIHPDWRDYLKSKWEDLLKGNIEPYFEYKIIHKSGDERWLHQRNILVCDADGHPLAIEGIVTDITDRKRVEELLKESEKRFRSIIQKSLDMIIILDQNGFIIYETPSLESILGYQPGYLIGKSPFEFIHPDDLEMAVNELNKVYLKTNPGIPTELRIRKVDGTWVYLEAIGQNLLEDPAINGIVITARDITDRKRKEEALKESEQRFSAIFENAADGILLADIETSKFYMGNKQICEALGYSAEEIKNLTVPDIHPAKDLPYVLDQFKKQASKEFTIAKDIPVKRKDGSIYYADVNSIPIQLMERMCLLGVFRDITDRKRAEEALRQSEAKYRFLTEKMNDIIWTTDLNFNITYQSPSVNKVLGFDRDDRMGQDVSKRITPESLARTIDLLNTELKHIQEEGVDPERTVKLELDCYHKNGSIISMECIASPIIDGEGKLTGIYGVSRDITDRKRAEHLLQISQKKFVAAFHYSPAPMVITDAESGKILDVNQACLAWSGFTLDEAIGHTTIELSILNAKERDKLVREVRDKGKAESLEMKYRIKGGDIRDILHSARPIEIDNKPCLISHIYDVTDQRITEKELKKHHDQLEELVRERTAELTGAYEQLKQENEVRKATELALRSRESELEKGRREVDEVNAALKVLLKHKEEDKANMESDIISNIKISVQPYIEKLEASRLEQSQKEVLSLIKSRLNDITSPFIRKISSGYLGFTPSEIKVASLIKEGRTSKDIAEILNISLNTVITHRHSIRKKTGLKNKKVNLRSYLQTSK